MISIGLFASLAAAFSLLCLLLNLAALALPVWVAGSVFFFAERSGEGLIGAGVLGLLSGGAVYFLGILSCSLAPSRALAVLITLLFAVPACAAGYHLGSGLGRLIFMSPVLQQFSAIATALLVFFNCWRRLAPVAAFHPPMRMDETEGYEQPIIDAVFTDVTQGREAPSSRQGPDKQFRLSPPRKLLID
jgi:hypothetical protein